VIDLNAGPKMAAEVLAGGVDFYPPYFFNFYAVGSVTIS
jgi:hypothetical protein